MKYNRGYTLFEAAFVLAFTAGLAFCFFLLYAVIHFLLKFW